MNILLRNLSWNDRVQSYCWKRERGMTRAAWNLARSMDVYMCVWMDGEGELGWTAVQESVSRNV